MLRVKRTGEFSKWRIERWPTARKPYCLCTCTEQVFFSPGDGGIAFQDAALQAVMQMFQMQATACI